VGSSSFYRRGSGAKLNIRVEPLQLSSTMIPILVLVEGESDAAAVRAVADLVGVDPASHGICIRPAQGVTHYPRVLSAFVRAHPQARCCGLYDIAEERYVRRALASAVGAVADGADLESYGFFACVADLEDELIRALGTDAVERVIEAEGELPSLRRFRAMPQRGDTPLQQQLRRFLGTRATRKIRCAPRLVRALPVARLPRPLANLASMLLEAASEAARGPAAT
jgi:hypothetical protein